MQSRFVEIRDEGTCIPALAMRMVPSGTVEAKYMGRVGYPRDGSAVVLMHLYNQKATSDPYEWQAMGYGTRTMPHAHLWIIEHWREIDDGDVIDVRVILGETNVPAEAEVIS